jgi:predicted Mrr-cat superfamily restriction endonuclease
MENLTKNRAWKIRSNYQSPQDIDRLRSGLVTVVYEVSGLRLSMSRVDIEKIVRQSYKSSTEKRISAHTGQIYRLLNEVKAGDLAVVPVNKGNSILLGRITETVQISGSGVISLGMTLLREGVSLKEFDQDLRYSFMAIMKFCEIRRNNAFSRLEKIAQGSNKPLCS